MGAALFFCGGHKVGVMSNAWGPADLRVRKTRRQIEILIVQSNPADTLLTVAAFKAAGVTHGLHCVQDGEETLAYLNRTGRHSHARTPDLLFLDLSQPRISGLEVLKVIKSTPELLHIPIVVAAGADDPKFVRAVYELNGSCFIKKPSDINEFSSFIEALYQFWNSIVTLSPKAEKAAAKCS